MEQLDFSIFEREEAQLMPASQGKRFANLLIDWVLYYGLYNGLTKVIIAISGSGLLDVFGYDSYAVIYLFSLIISLSFHFLFYGVTEALFKGKSLGKLVTGTRAVNEDGSHISVKTAFLRSLCRLVPFEVFSALGNPSRPWHDRWSRTYVIDEKQSFYPENILDNKY